MNAWKIVLITSALTAAVSFFIAGTIHLLSVLIRRFSAPELEPATPTVGLLLQADAQQDMDIAVAIAAVKEYLVNSVRISD
ncbi:MAG: hypothetical protein WCG22_01720 [Lentisphaerota bacterium]|jgi:hypothetical protein